MSLLQAGSGVGKGAGSSGGVSVLVGSVGGVHVGVGSAFVVGIGGEEGFNVGVGGLAGVSSSLGSVVAETHPPRRSMRMISEIRFLFIALPGHDSTLFRPEEYSPNSIQVARGW